LEQRHQDIFVDLRAEITNKYRVLWATLVTGKELANISRLQGCGKGNKNRDSDRRSARPPPEAQLSLNGRDVFGIMEPLRERAFAAAAGEEKSIKQ
jgi:hypothetical protein